jgi:hypothetical protein
VPESAGELSVRLTASIADLNRGLTEAGRKVDQFGKQSQASLEALGRTVAGVFTAGAVLSWIKQGVAGFAEYERALDSLGNKVRAAGGDWAGLRGGVEDYLRSVKESTRFSDDEALAALDALMLKTNDLNASMRLSERAMDLAVAAHIPLTEAANTLALAYQGNQRGLMMLSRQLGITGDAAKDVDKVFAELERRTAGLARGEDNLATNLAKARHQIEDAAKAMGEALAPAISRVAAFLATVIPRAVDFIINLGQVVGVALGDVTVMILNYLDLWADRFGALGRFLVDVWRSPIEAAKGFARDLDDAQEGYAFKERERQKATSDLLTKMAEDTERKKTDSAKKGALDRTIVAKKEQEELVGMVRSELSFFDQQMKKRETIFSVMARGISAESKTLKQKVQADDKEATEHFKGLVKEREEAAKASAQAAAQSITEFTTGMVTSVADGLASVVAHVVETGRITADAWKEAGTLVLRSFLKMLGKQLIEEAGWYAARAVAALLSVVGAAAAPGLFLAAAKSGAAGAALLGLASSVKLAAGGIITRPTMALVGEEGPEAVIPLDRAGGLVGLSIRSVSMVFPNVRREEDLRGPRFAMTAARELARVQQDLNIRRGVKGV